MLALALTYLSLAIAPAAQEAFEALGNDAGVTFSPVEAWADAAEADVPKGGPFWEQFDAISRQSGYEPVFQPYGEGPTLALRRVDVRGEETVRPAMAGRTLYARPARVVVTRTPNRARLTLDAAQVALEVELFVEPGDIWTGEPADRPVAVFATTAGLRGEGTVTLADGRPFGLTLRRPAEDDPSVPLRGGVGLLSLRFDADTRLQYAVPERFGPWRALARVAYAERWGDFGRELRPGSPGEPVEHGGVAVGVASFAVREGDAGRRASLTLSMPKPAGTSLGDWLRLYGFLQAIPPTLLGPDGTAWRRTSAIVYGVPDPHDVQPDSTPNPLSSREWRVMASFAEPEEAGGDGDAFRLEWSLPTASSEQRVPLIWRDDLPVLLPEGLVP